MKPILEVAYLTDDHGRTLEKCPGCKICDRIAELRELLDPNPTVKYKHILEKGKDIKPSEVQYLLDKGIDRKTIAKHIKMGIHEFNKVMENHGLFEVKKRRAVDEMAGKIMKFNMTKEQAEQLAAEGKNKSEIAKIAGVSLPTFLHHAKKWEGKVEKQTQPKTTANEEYNSLIEQLKEQLKQKDGTIENLEKKIEQLENEVKNIHAAANDTESELMIDADTWKHQALNYKAENERLNKCLEEVREEKNYYKGVYALSSGLLKAVL